MIFDLEKVKQVNKEEWRGSANRKFTDEELIEALESDLFSSQAAIARYFGVSTAAISQRIKKLREKGLIK